MSDKSLRIVFIGCVAFSHDALRRVLALPDARLAGVVTRRTSPANADFRPLDDLAELARVPVFHADDADDEAMAAFVAGCRPDVVYCFGWPRLLGRRILDVAPLGVVGFHPAALPRNRGRHPLVWAIALGLRETASTFFMMDEGADSGDIVDQRPVVIRDDDTAASLYARVTETALGQIAELTRALAHGTCRRVPQAHAHANTWRKRARRDGEIDWRMSARAIYDLVRALTRPYVGAHIDCGGTPVRVWRAEIGPEVDVNLEPGRVVSADGAAVVVKCWDGSVRLVEHEFAQLPPVGSCL